jgi:hypothetical protein
MTDQEALFQIIENQLVNYKNFQMLLPKDYPRNKKYKITNAKMTWYNDNRNKEHWSHFNLPFILVNNERSTDIKVNGLTKSILEKFDEFARRFSNLPGVNNTLKPLWKSAWDLADPKMWSVLSECALAVHYNDKGLMIHGFGQKIGAGLKNSDIRLEFQGKITHVDVEMQNIKDLIRGSRFSFRKLVVHRGRKKLEGKFQNLPENELGVAAIIFSVSGENFLRLQKQKLWVTRPVYLSFFIRNPFAQIYWLVGGNINKTFGFHIIDNGTILQLESDLIDRLMDKIVNYSLIKWFERKLLKFGADL